MTNTRSPQPARRRGLAMIMAMALMALVALLLVTLASVTRTQAHYSRHTAEEAQLRQLLLAGERAAALALDEVSTDGDELTVPLPAALREADGELLLRITSPEADRRNVHVQAVLGDRAADQQLRYHRTDAGWRLRDARLGRMR